MMSLNERPSSMAILKKTRLTKKFFLRCNYSKITGVFMKGVTNLVELSHGGLSLGSSLFLNDANFKSGQNWLKNNPLALLVLIRDPLFEISIEKWLVSYIKVIRIEKWFNSL